MSSTIYKEKIIDHYKNPRNFGKLDEFTHHGIASNESCGDKIEVWVQIDENDTILEIGFEGEGCVLAMGASSILTSTFLGEHMPKKSTDVTKDLVDELGLEFNPTREKCLRMFEVAFKNALYNNETESV